MRTRVLANLAAAVLAAAILAGWGVDAVASCAVACQASDSPPLARSLAPAQSATPAAPVKTAALKPSATAATMPAPAESDVMRGARLQTALARSGFSPGLIDGRPGRKTRLALEQFQAANGLVISGVADEATAEALKTATGLDGVATAASSGSWTRMYRITEADLDLVTGPIPTDWNERALLEKSGYADLQELLGERGWCSADFMASLNPGVNFATLTAGDEVVLPDVPDALIGKGKGAALPKLARLEVNLTEKYVRGFTDSGAQVMFMHCSIAKAQEKRPLGELKVKVVAMDPEYTFDPKDWPEIDNVTSKLKIAPGPRNPVGAAWVGLDKPGYGIHGTVRPQDIGKTGSHGCFRLANWDAARLARAVRIGMLVTVME